MSSLLHTILAKITHGVLVMPLAPLLMQGALAQDNAGKSGGPVVTLPRTQIQEGKLEMHLPGREYKAGSGWWALACPGRCELYPLTLTIKAEKHPVYDGDPVPGQRLNFNPVPAISEALAIFKPLRLKQPLNLQAGPVPTYYPGLQPRLRRPASAGTMEGEVGLPKGQSARLVPVLLMPEEGNQNADRRYEQPNPPLLTLELHMDGRRQSLGSFSFGIEGTMALKPSDYLIWAGDLDGDGKPDFLINFDFHGTEQTLFLSTLAEGDELVGLAGSFKYFPIDSAGC